MSDQSTTLDLDALERAARAATPGEWFEYGEPEVNYPYTVHVKPTGSDTHHPVWDEPLNISFIALANPATILSFAAEIRALQERVEGAEKARDEWQDNFAALSRAITGGTGASAIHAAEALRSYAHEATKTIIGLTAGGSEYFDREVAGIYLADLPFCADRIRGRFATPHDRAARTKAGEPHEQE